MAVELGVKDLFPRPEIGASASKLTADPPDPEPNRWHLGVESVFSVSDNGGKVLPGAGIAVGKTPEDSGFIFDAGLYVMGNAGLGSAGFQVAL